MKLTLSHLLHCWKVPGKQIVFLKFLENIINLDNTMRILSSCSVLHILMKKKLTKRRETSFSAANACFFRKQDLRKNWVVWDTDFQTAWQRQVGSTPEVFKFCTCPSHTKQTNRPALQRQNEGVILVPWCLIGNKTTPLSWGNQVFY